MQTDVNLQPEFQYPILWVILLVLVFMGILFGIFHKKKAKEEKEIKVIEPVRDRVAIQQEYLGKIEQLAADYTQGKVKDREAFLSVSELVRNFAFEMTGVSVQNYSLSEIEKLGLPSLTVLIQECYVPEFDEAGLGNAMMTINKTKEVIRAWN